MEIWHLGTIWVLTRIVFPLPRHVKKWFAVFAHQYSAIFYNTAVENDNHEDTHCKENWKDYHVSNNN